MSDELLRVTTESGATYLLDALNQRVMRQGPHSPGIDYEAAPDGMWHLLDEYTVPVVGHPWHMEHADGGYRLTTPVVAIEPHEEGQ